MLIHTSHAVPMPFPCRAVSWPLEVAYSAAWARHGMCESHKVALCNQMGTTQSKSVATRHGRSTASYVCSRNGLSLAKYLLISCLPLLLEPHVEGNESVKGLLRGLP